MSPWSPHVLVKLLEILVGMFCVFTAFLLYPNQEKEIQSTLEDFWIRVDDYREVALSRHTAFLAQVAQLETRLLDRVFGHKLIAAQALEMSFGISIATTSLIYMWQLYHAGAWHGSFMRNDFWVFVCSLIILAASIFLRNQAVIRGSLILLALAGMFYWMVYGLDYGLHIAVPREIALSRFKSAGLGVILIALGSFLSNTAFIACTRVLIRWAGKVASSPKIVAIIGLNVVMAVLLTNLDAIVPLPFDIRSDLEAISYGNLFTAVLALLFVFLAAMLLIHRLLWPILTRTVFRIQEVGTLGRRTILFGVGSLLLSVALFGGHVPEWVKPLSESLGNVIHH